MIAMNKQIVNNETSATAAETLSKLDLVSIEALISYMAHQHEVDELFVKRAVLVHFKVDELKKLPRADRDTAIKFLVDYKLVANSR